GDRHRMSIGTITSDAAITVKYQSGGHIGTVEERFIARLRPGDRFLFAGLSLELIRVRELVAYVKRSRASRQAVPRWQGGRLPLSTALADEMLELLAEYNAGRCKEPEVLAIRPLLDLQARWSELPQPECLLVERTDSREGQHLFIFPFAGRLAHEGLASLFAWRLGQKTAGTFSLAANDYGLEIVSHELPDINEALLRDLLSSAQLTEHLLASLNAGELVRRQFRDIARVAGLIFQGYPGKGKSARQLQASSGLMFDTLQRYDPSHRLLDQAAREVLESTLEVSRIEQTLIGLSQARISIQTPARFTPLAFPLWAERQRNRLSTERWSDRVAAMVARLEKAADRA
ncbi:MAG: DNA ligase-associated DEXH box helicase, partial [Gammaproteobacteria bacterium]|nr:DNA ligase-associated DEXH box helicase [Gammaproteobacteria bacterium]